MFTSPIPASCSRRRPKSLIAQLRAGLKKDKIEKERWRGKGRGIRIKRRENVYDCEKEKKSWLKFFFHEKRGKIWLKKKLLLLAALFVKRGCQALYNTWD